MVTKPSQMPVSAPKYGQEVAGQPLLSDSSPDVQSAETSQKVAGSQEGAKRRSRPSRKKKRRQQHGSAWHWDQTDSWYYTMPGTKKRIPLFDEDGNRIKGKENKDKARLALARVRLTGEDVASTPAAPPEQWLVAKVSSEYLQYCNRGVASGSLSKSHADQAKWALNALCKYCGALPVSQLKKAHIKQ